MKLMPHRTTFFINAWTWGYEDVIKAVSKAFGCKVFSFMLVIWLPVLLLHRFMLTDINTRCL